ASLAQVYISSLTDGAEVFKLIREHWAVENKLHYMLDYCCPIKVRKDIPRGLNCRIEAVELSIFDFQAPF
ncbi:MAG: hypothetical protein SOX65_04280, partial [Porphyromonas sp.]|nr:hypothetical protein [Porphyromonas sp.]